MPDDAAVPSVPYAPGASRPLAVIVLAAGAGTRMKSRAPKVLHGFAGRSMLGHVLAAAGPLHAEHTVVVIGAGRDQVLPHLQQTAPDAVPVVQEHQKGTGHATRLALQAVPDDASGTVLVLPGDAPLLTPQVLAALVAEHEQARAAATLLTSVLDDPTGYGRVIRDDLGAVHSIIEHRDATAEQLAITEIGTSVYAFDHALLREAITRISSDNSQGEEYLPDVVAIFGKDGHRLAAVTAPAALTAGCNDRVQLAAAARTYNTQLLEEHMRAGVTIVDPATTWVDADVTIGPDVTIAPSVELHGRTRIAAGAYIGPHSSLTDTVVEADARVTRTVAIGAEIGARADVGPFAYLRTGSRLAEGAHVGTYVEVKNSEIGPGTKVPHLSYVGDATIGAGSNIGAATIFANYDGVEKHHSVVGDQVRIGSDTVIVAPREIGDGSYTAAGSVITEDVPPGALAVARGRQANVAGWVLRKRPGTPPAEAAEQALGTEDGER